MDYCSGGDLFHYMSEGLMPTREAQLYGAELALALSHLHGYNIAFRDLKPENCLIAQVLLPPSRTTCRRPLMLRCVSP